MVDGQEEIDWQGLLRVGLGVLRLSPDVFWTMTPAELRLALEGAGFLNPGNDLPLDRDRLATLMRDFPDDDRANSLDED